MNDSSPIFSFTDDKDPVAFWKANYPDSDGIEVLSILTMILEAGYVRVDEGTPQEMYVWPYFVRMSLSALTPQQKVELFRIVTGADYKDMMKLRRHLAFLRHRRLKRARSMWVGRALRGPWSRTRTCCAGAMPTRLIRVGKIARGIRAICCSRAAILPTLRTANGERPPL